MDPNTLPQEQANQLKITCKRLILLGASVHQPILYLFKNCYRPSSSDFWNYINVWHTQESNQINKDERKMNYNYSILDRKVLGFRWGWGSLFYKGRNYQL